MVDTDATVHPMIKIIILEKKPLNGKVKKDVMCNVVQLHAAACPAPTPVNGKVTPRRRKNGEVLSREYLVKNAADKLMGAASVGRLTVCNLIIVDIGSFITYNPIKQG